MAATHRRAAGTGVLLALLFAFAAPAHAAFPGQNGKLAYQHCPFRCGISTIDETGLTEVTVGGVFGPIGAQVIVNDASRPGRRTASGSRSSATSARRAARSA